MTETPNNPEDLNSGKLVGLLLCFSLAEQRGDLPRPLTNNLRSAVRKVAEVLHLDEDQDLRSVDQDEVFRRFHTLARAELRDETRVTYEKRTRDALDRYRKFLDNDPSWKQVALSSKPKRTKSVTAVDTEQPVMATVTVMPNISDLVSVPVPLRRNVVAHLSLPADLTESEAKRIARIVEAYGGGGQLQLPPSTSTGTEG